MPSVLNETCDCGPVRCSCNVIGADIRRGQPAGATIGVDTRVLPSALDKQEGGDHYKKQKIQPIEYIHANNIPFAEGCVIKYVTRWRDKGGIKDLEKAKHFIELLIELESRG